MRGVPPERVRDVNGAPVRRDGRYVLYWMIAARRSGHSFALDRAAALSRETGRPLLVLEALRCGYPFASDRLHRFVLDGMAENARAFRKAGVGFHPYVEAAPGAGKGLLEALAASACAVVTDDFPAFFLPSMVAAAGRRLGVRLEAVDGNGLLPMRAAPRVFHTAASFRRFLQGDLPGHLGRFPSPRPLAARWLAGARLPPGVGRRWPAAPPRLLAAGPAALAALPIDHGVQPAPARGGSREGSAVLRRFLSERLARYGERNHPDAEAASGLSPWLHFGHVSAHQVFAALARRERWGPARLAPKPNGSREGWWGMGPAAEAFLDELVTWRELGFNMASKRDDAGAFGSLPPWAHETLGKHAGDRRERVYSLHDLEAARTHDPIWNAAQTELVHEGRIQNYLRMLWGKKILEWTRAPEEALAVMLRLNDRWALDGRDPSSLSGIFWVLGRYDRPWGPERPVFGRVRYMSSEAARRKLRMKAYLARYGGP